MMEIFKTEGTWRILPAGLVREYAKLEEYVPNDCEVPFYFGHHYNYGDLDGMVRFKSEHNIQEIFEIIEVFREPYNDVDAAFRGRSLLIARLATDLEALVFKLAVPHPEPVRFVPL